MTQRSSTTAFAKSTRPEMTGIVMRESLFARLDGTPARTVAWVSAPAGFGKTTLAASYLEARGYRWAWFQVDADDSDAETFLHYLAHAMRRLRTEGPELPAFGPEHHADLAAFARRFFRALFSGTVGPTALVLDNFNEPALGSALTTLLEAGLPQVPRQCCVIVTGRLPPPVGLARLQPSGQMVCLAADDLRLTAQELDELARLRGKPLAQEALQDLQQRTEGWAAALVLMVEHMKMREGRTSWSADATPAAVFAYLAGEIFDHFEPDSQRLLLHLACLPRVTVEVACALSGDDSAGRVLFNLAHNDYFVRELVGPEGRVFVFHPLLREFLLQRASRDLPQAVGPAALRRAAQLLRRFDQAEDALALLVACKDWADVAAIVLEQAEVLQAQGRHATLAGWIELLPPQLLAGMPALRHAQGMALSHASPRVARRCFEEAFDGFQRRADVPGMVRSCQGVIAVLLHEFDDLTGLDRWLAEHGRCRMAAHDDSDPPAAVVVARLWRDPGHASVAQFRRRRGAQQDAQSDIVRLSACWLCGDFAGAAVVAGQLGGLSGAMGVATAVSEALGLLVDGQGAAALEVAQRGLSLGAAEAIHGFDAWLHMLRAAAALSVDDPSAARAALDAAEGLALRRGDRAFFHHVRAGLALAGGELGAALREARSATQLAVEAGLPWLEGLSRVMLAPMLAAASDRVNADAQLRSVQELAQRLASPMLQVSALFAQAAVALQCNDEAAAQAPLQTGLTRSRELGIHHVPGLTSELMGRLCANALRRGLATDQARLLVTACRLAPPPDALRLRSWPWAFEITTLGGFGLQRAGAPIEFSAKGPGRPVELLKVLISMGGLNVRADQLADALWPHVDADYAHKSFTATLHRLRRIFGGDDTLKLSDGRLSLNTSQFWVDTWAFDQLLNEIDGCLRADDVRAADGPLAELMGELLLLYRGSFLPDEAEQPTYIARREQTRGRLLRALTRVSRRWEEVDHRDAVIDGYLRCIEADELCEGFYRNLMLCYQRHGEVAEALATYERLEAVLAARLRGLPSPETQALRASLRAPHRPSSDR